MKRSQDLTGNLLVDTKARIRSHRGRFTRFSAVGVSGVVVNFLALMLAVELFGMNHLVAGVIATEIAILNNFALNDRWTFGDMGASRSWPGRLLRYHSVALGGLVITVVSLAALVDGVGLHYPVANAFGIVAAMLWNYSGNFRFTWSERGDGVPLPRSARAVMRFGGRILHAAGHLTRIF